MRFADILPATRAAAPAFAHDFRFPGAPPTESVLSSRVDMPGGPYCAMYSSAADMGSAAGEAAERERKRRPGLARRPVRVLGLALQVRTSRALSPAVLWSNENLAATPSEPMWPS